MNDTLLDRYLQAVGKYLPEATRTDTLNELRANLLDRADALAEELGHPLTDADMATLLRELGKPEAVALRYLPQRSLIGPEVFPFYEYTLRKASPLVVFVYTAACAVEFVNDRHVPFRDALASYSGGLVSTLLSFVAIVTIVFAVIDILRHRPDVRAKLAAWDPMKLPHVSAHATPSEVSTLVKRALDLCFHCLWFAYVLWFPAHPFWVFGPGVTYFGTLGMALGPVWHTFYAVLVLLLAVQLVLKLLAFVPGMQEKLAAMELLTGLVGLTLLGVLAHAGVYFIAAGSDVNLHQMADVNQGLSAAFRVVFVIVALNFVKHVWRFAKRFKTVRSQFAF